MYQFYFMCQQSALAPTTYRIVTAANLQEAEKKLLLNGFRVFQLLPKGHSQLNGKENPTKIKGGNEL